MVYSNDTIMIHFSFVVEKIGNFSLIKSIVFNRTVKIPANIFIVESGVMRAFYSVAFTILHLHLPNLQFWFIELLLIFRLTMLSQI